MWLKSNFAFIFLYFVLHIKKCHLGRLQNITDLFQPKYLHLNDGYAFWLRFAASVRGDIANPWQDRCRCSRAVSFLSRGRMHEIKKGRNGATKPFGSSDRSITISREYKCLREQPTDAVQFGVGPALPFNLVTSPLLISFHRPAPSITNRCNFFFRSCPSI